MVSYWTPERVTYGSTIFRLELERGLLFKTDIYFRAGKAVVQIAAIQIPIAEYKAARISTVQLIKPLQHLSPICLGMGRNRVWWMVLQADETL